MKNNRESLDKNKKNTYFEIFKPIIIFAIAFVGFVFWVTSLMIISKNGKLLQINLSAINIWIILFSFIISYRAIILFILPKILPKIIHKNNFIGTHIFGYNKSNIFKMIYSFFWGSTLFSLFIFINASFSNEYYQVRCSPVDAWEIRASKNVKKYLKLKFQDDYNSYLFDARISKSINWKFDSLENSENFKGFYWRDYPFDFLINYFLESKYVDINIQKGYFGIDIIDNIIIEPNLHILTNDTKLQ